MFAFVCEGRQLQEVSSVQQALTEIAVYHKGPQRSGEFLTKYRKAASIVIMLSFDFQAKCM